MHLTRIRLGGVPPFTDPIDLKFDPRVNVFIGPNASGKSTLLRQIETVSNPSSLTKDTESNFIEASDDWPVDGERLDRNAVASLGIPAARVYLPSEPIDYRSRKPVDFPEDGFKDTALEMLSLSDARVFDGVYVENAFDIFQTVLEGPDYTQFGKAVMLGYNCAKSIASEVIRGYAPHPFVEYRESEDYFSDAVRILHPGMGIGTNDYPDWFPKEELLYAGMLSSGTQGTLLWIWALALKMAYDYNWTVGWEEKPAILFIDEIENHLHPTWQRRVIPALLEYFPGLQIFATTHSPFVVAGLEAGQVHKLERDDNGVVRASTESRDVVGWTADEILRGMMGVEEPTDQRTVDRAKRLRALREQDGLTAQEEEELNQLRRQVNSDLLSKGGLLEEQKERYANLVQDFLRMRENELSQDGE